MERKWWTILAILFLISRSSAAVLLGADCPNQVYAHELFTCTVYCTTDSDQASVKLVIHSAEGHFDVLLPKVKEINVAFGELTRVDVNCWAKEVGGDALVVDGEYDDKKIGALTAVKIAEPSVKAFFQTVTAQAGKTKVIKIRLRGNGDDIHVKLVSPTSSIAVEGEGYIEMLNGEKTLEFRITPAPTAVGSYRLQLLLDYIDDTGSHVLEYEVPVWVNPSFVLVGGVFLALLVVLAIVYLFYRRLSGGKKKEANEAQ